MAGKPKPMSQVKQMLRMRLKGKGIKTIARNLQMSKNTVKEYFRKVEASNVSITELLKLEDPILEAKLLAGNPSFKDERYELLKVRLEYFAKELKKVGVNRKVLYEEYCVDNANPYSYSQFCYHLQQYRKSSKPTMVLEHHPGDKLYIDFAGKPLSYINRDTGEIIFVQVFVACLPYSDYSFAMAVPSQKLEDFLYALRCCLNDIGGVPHTLVPDNLKSAVIKANRYEPDINRALEDFANHYSTTVTPARPAHPQDKALVENQVKLIYSRVYAKLRHRQFFDLASLNEAIAEKMKLHNQTRMQQKDYCREEKFLADEKKHLLELPVEPIEIKYYREHKAAKNNHIYLSQDKHYYSVPYTYIGEKTKVIYTRTLVKIYCKGNQIAVHPRGFKKGGYTTKKEHLCSHHQFYKERSPSYYLGRANAHSEELYQYMEALFNQNKHPEQLYRTCDGILNLSRKTPRNTFVKACDIALENHNYSYRFLKQLLENKMTENTLNIISKPLPEHSNIRGATAYK
ncbi:IS21 family transposase [Aequorivita sp. F47161]|uniref:IS21 family transposase n=1 Tax=Aequorivita vitellina TaxID=2874475 RepID=A0A9X1U2C3_9FLAO|nr:IS21 family transposase [Aequorivita vitellina]MCG2420514.1 IS21 family transposase [Aequorivita vitellina]